MADGVHPLDGFRGHPGRAQVGPDKLGSLHHPGRVTVDDADVMTGVQEGLDHMRPDEPASPGDQDPHLEPPVVDVILPVLDERAALPGVLASIPAGYRAVVVDNGSTDGSGQVAASLGAAGGERTAAGVRGGLLRRPARRRGRCGVLHGLRRLSRRGGPAQGRRPRPGGPGRSGDGP